MLQRRLIGGVHLYVRDGTWDGNIAREVIEGDVYRIRGWRPTNPVTIVDVGAHIGAFSAWCATYLNQSQVFAFEMDEENYEVAKQNLSVFPNVKLFHAAVGSRDGDVKRNERPGENTGGAAVEWSALGGERVPAMSIETVLGMLPHQYADCLKLDCEGSEIPIMHSLVKGSGLRRHVGCLRAELHANKGSAAYKTFMRSVRDGFAFTDAVSSTDDLHNVFGWR